MMGRPPATSTAFAAWFVLSFAMGSSPARAEADSVNRGWIVSHPDEIIGYLLFDPAPVADRPLASARFITVAELAADVCRQAAGDVRQADGRGRRPTVARELVALPRGGMIIDTPGIRAVGLTASETGVLSTFADIGELAISCHLRDCRHLGGPNCAVRAATESGDLSPDRLADFHKLWHEIEVASMKTDPRLRTREKHERKTISRAGRE